MPGYRKRIMTIPFDASVVAGGRPLRLDRSADRAVMLIHGYTGCTGDMAYLGGRLAEAGFTVSIPRLPGHGTNGKDFLATRWTDWLRHCIDHYLELRREFTTVFVGGLSMGGVLTLALASEFAIPRIALAAPAMAVSNHFAFLAEPLSLFVGRLAKRYEVSEEDRNDPDRAYLAAEYWQWEWVAPAAQLLALRRAARRALSRVHAETLTIVSKGDRTVPLRAADIIERGIGSTVTKRVVLEKSGHVVVSGVEKERVAQEFCDWFLR